MGDAEASRPTPGRQRHTASYHRELPQAGGDRHMIVAPAIELRGGRCARIPENEPATGQTSWSDPAATARHWWETGFGTLHLVDLDAAANRGNNLDQIHRIVQTTEAIVHVAGGLQDRRAIDQVLRLGVNRVIVGGRAAADVDRLARLAEKEPWRMIVAADTADGLVGVRGRKKAGGIPLDEFVTRLDGLPLAGVLMTDLAREDRMEGINPALVDRTVAATSHPFWISGGVTNELDLRAAEGCGVHGVVLGTALYAKAMDAERIARAYGR